MWSVRGRITLVAGVAVGLVLMAVGVLLLNLQESAATKHLDELLSDEAESIGAALGAGGSLPPLLDDDRVLLVVGPDGGIVVSRGDTSGLHDFERPRKDEQGVDLNFAGEEHRVIAESYLTETGAGTVLVAEPRDELDDSITVLRDTLKLVIPITLAALIAIIWWVVGLALRPVERMRAEVDALGIRQLDRRLVVPPGGDELTRLAETLNGMLARLEAAVRRQQRFVADASHELRTPLARMRAEVEATGTSADAEARISQLTEIASLQQMIDDMLLLARADVDPARVRSDPVDLDDIVMDEVRAARSVVGATPAIDVRDVSAAQVEGSADELRRAVRNLLDNAIRHANKLVTVGLAERDDRAVLTVDDDGRGVPDERRQEVFERFRRLDPVRSGTGHAGLGLAIVAEVAVRHEGTVTIEDSQLGGARFVLTIPIGDHLADERISAESTTST